MSEADLYLRLSVDFEGATSIERQERDCRRWCADHGLSVRTVHVDRGVSGFVEGARRDGLEAALTAVFDGVVSTLVVWKLDRLSRRGVGQVGQVLDRFERAHARLVSVQDQLDTAQPQARMVIALLSEFARAESETIGVRVRSAKAAQRAQGLWLSGKPPYGYEIAPDRRLRQVEPAASIMREVFTQLAAGHTLYSVCADLNSRGVPNSRGNRWQVSSLSEAIRNPVYAGLTPARHVSAYGRHASGVPPVYRDADTGFEVSCLSLGERPIVCRGDQLAVFDMLRTRQSRFGRGAMPRRPAHALLLRGLGRCGACDGPLVTFNGYRCRTVNRYGDRSCIAPVSASVSAVDTHVEQTWLQQVVARSEQSPALRTLLVAWWANGSERSHGAADARAELVDLRTRLDDADLAHYVRGDLDARRHALVCAELTRRIQAAEHAVAEADAAVDMRLLGDEQFVRGRWRDAGYDGRRKLLAATWSKVVVAKAKGRGGRFETVRISFHPHS